MLWTPNQNETSVLSVESGIRIDAGTGKVQAERPCKLEEYFDFDKRIRIEPNDLVHNFCNKEKNVKSIFLTVVTLGLSFAASAQSTTVAVPANQNTASAAHMNELSGTPEWQFQVGLSNYTGNENSSGQATGRGLLLGATYDVMENLGVGGTFTEYKVTQDGSGMRFSDTIDSLAGFAEFKPIRYTFEHEMSLQASLLAGLLFQRQLNERNQSSPFFYGAALTMAFNNQIGGRVEMQVSREFQSLTSVSVVGYY